MLVAAHAGTEFATRENDQQRRLARTLTASGDVDLVYMHHTHVVQPWAKVNGRWVVYGLGNAVGQQSPNRPRTYEGVTARFTFTRSGSGRFAVSKAEYIPTLVTRYARSDRPGCMWFRPRCPRRAERSGDACWSPAPDPRRW